MNFAAYADIWRLPAVRQAVLLGALGKAPWFGAGVVLTLHVVGALGQTYARAGLLTAVFTIAIALASAARDVALPAHVAAVGEISLTGEIRPATSMGRRLHEAERLGYRRVLNESAGDIATAVEQALRPPPAAMPDF